MSKTEKMAGFPDTLVNSETVSELDSRLRELEKNIAVAREFIKLADESYSELRHQWNLLQQETGEKANVQTEHSKAPQREPFRIGVGKKLEKTKRKTSGIASSDGSSLDNPPANINSSPVKPKNARRAKTTDAFSEAKEFVQDKLAGPARDEIPRHKKTSPHK